MSQWAPAKQKSHVDGPVALYRRAAEAVTVRGLADDLLAGQGDHLAVVVLGDLNDEPEAATTQILLGPPGSEIGTGGFDVPDRGDVSRLWNLAPLILLRVAGLVAVPGGARPAGQDDA